MTIKHSSRWFYAVLAALFLYACGGSGGSITIPVPGLTAAHAQSTQSCTTQFGSFTMTATGFEGTVSGTANYKLWPCDNRAEIYLPPLAGVSNTNTFTAGPLPAALMPATIQYQEHVVAGFDNDVETPGMSIEIEQGDSSIHYLKLGNENGWTASGSKGVGDQIVVVWLD
jgi:hypothetical protein